MITYNLQGIAKVSFLDNKYKSHLFEYFKGKSFACFFAIHGYILNSNKIYNFLLSLSSLITVQSFDYGKRKILQQNVQITVHEPVAPEVEG